MYVAPTPLALTSGLIGQQTLIVPAEQIELLVDDRLHHVGTLVRTEADSMVVGYTFDLRINSLTPMLAPNPSAGTDA